MELPCQHARQGRKKTLGPKKQATKRNVRTGGVVFRKPKLHLCPLNVFPAVVLNPPSRTPQLPCFSSSFLLVSLSLLCLSAPLCVTRFCLSFVVPRPCPFLCPVDPLYRLEHEQRDKRRAASRKTVLTRLTELADAHAQDDYSSNARLRQTMRARKKKEREREEEATVRIGQTVATLEQGNTEAVTAVVWRASGTMEHSWRWPTRRSVSDAPRVLSSHVCFYFIFCCRGCQS